MGGRPWTDFDTAKEWIRLPAQEGELRIVAYYL
jgi:hypothetical protein